MRGVRTFFLVALLTLSSSLTFGQGDDRVTRILFLLDASNSMYTQMDNASRMQIAKKLLSEMVDSLERLDHVEIALRVYGHQSNRERQNCKDTKLEVPFGKLNHKQVKDKIATISPKGTTLIAYSLQQAAYDFPTDPKARNIIILITDGLEECQGDPCAVSTALQKQGVILKPFIIGVGVDKEFRSQFECVGKYFEANSKKAFEDVLGVVISQALDNTTAQINLLDENGRPTETDVNISFYRAGTKKLASNLVHTMNTRGIPDTIYLDPALDYDIVVHTIPPVEKNNIEIVPGKHNIIAVDIPQGNLALTVRGRSGYGRLSAIVTKHGSSELIHVQDFNSTEVYLTGTYDIEILSLPRIKQKNVIISQDKTTTLEIKQPGQLNVRTAYDFVGDIYRWHNGEFEWVCNLDITSNNRDPIPIQPGKYHLVVRSKTENNTANTQNIEFEISSGQVTSLTI